MHARGMAQSFYNAARTTQDCESICVQTIQYCLEMGGEHVTPSHMQLLQDCADICEITAKVMLRSSPQHGEIAAVCANICELCAASCERFGGDAQMKACANQCLLCAAACRQMGTGKAGTMDSTFRGPGAQGPGAQGTGAHGSRHP
jgi:hypothetical protein